ncbi:hypothetical protein PXK30_03720 [Phaeobacter gallaeciensis]|uniref:hypothetical protein n=1 Tax=Phaeobacter gallaeciensis TaxID=60890 RepID=UPI00237FBCD9|nr:hypothetical protein [Phaeobacter gallaeciensis]MDE4304016.1 hypothetical protein [Phaeobacter gallaeciensis]MDE4309076.1 hypothetical protein [Phaeobacter gallaeciensis]MDE4313370.1 hypothetical protein [Phaeobacter gallaeciensis]MDE4318005.1 hypothetical protein [Phaeobacter gallaeciensis]MDE4322468.1 hypothetical protein [Phaeobacter gallaeciensis]
MAEQKKPQKKTYTVTSAFVWDKGIKKPDDTVDLTDSEAYGLKKRGKIKDPETGRKKAATGAKKDETTDPAKAPA